MFLTLILLAQLQTPHFRNTFAVATESVIDTISAVDIPAPAPSYDAQLKSATTARDNLKAMASEEGEQDVVSAVESLYFAVQACHIQAVDNTDTTSCRTQISHARTRAMQMLGKHKDHSTWADGPPA